MKHSKSQGTQIFESFHLSSKRWYFDCKKIFFLFIWGFIGDHKLSDEFLLSKRHVGQHEPKFWISLFSDVDLLDQHASILLLFTSMFNLAYILTSWLFQERSLNFFNFFLAAYRYLWTLGYQDGLFQICSNLALDVVLIVSSRKWWNFLLFFRRYDFAVVSNSISR